MNIVQIIDGCKSDDVRCQKIFYERFYGYALKIAFRYMNQYEMAADVTNAGFVKMYSLIKRFDYKESHFLEQLLMAWIKRIIINKCVDELSKNKMTREIDKIPEYVWEIAGEKSEQSHLFKELIGCVKNLPPILRIVFNMFVIDEYTHVEIAKSLGISIGTSQSNLSRARVILQKLIEDRKQLRIVEDKFAAGF
jgi:RNA polymerase sigma factor (sigma-70 family)